MLGNVHLNNKIPRINNAGQININARLILAIVVVLMNLCVTHAVPGRPTKVNIRSISTLTDHLEVKITPPSNSGTSDVTHYDYSYEQSIPLEGVYPTKTLLNCAELKTLGWNTPGEIELLYKFADGSQTSVSLFCSSDSATYITLVAGGSNNYANYGYFKN